MRKGRAVASRRVEPRRRSNSPNFQKSEWWGFLDRGKVDLETCKKVDAQLSAYLAQQAVEKHAKALILKCGINITPDKLGHFVLRTMIGELINQQERLRCGIAKGKELPIQQVKENWKHGNSVLRRLEKEDALKEIVFKDSLGMSHNDKDRKIMDEFKASLNVCVNPDIFYTLNMIRIAVSSKIRRMRRRHTSFADSGEAKCVAIQAIMVVSPRIAYMFPHETYGRYPIAVGDRRAAQIYESQGKELEKLVSDARKDCRFLEKVVSAMPDMS